MTTILLFPDAHPPQIPLSPPHPQCMPRRRPHIHIKLISPLLPQLPNWCETFWIIPPRRIQLGLRRHQHNHHPLPRSLRIRRVLFSASTMQCASFPNSRPRPILQPSSLRSLLLFHRQESKESALCGFFGLASSWTRSPRLRLRQALPWKSCSIARPRRQRTHCSLLICSNRSSANPRTRLSSSSSSISSAHDFISTTPRSRSIR